jgi:hypothetical protein
MHLRIPFVEIYSRTASGSFLCSQIGDLGHLTTI